MSSPLTNLSEEHSNLPISPFPTRTTTTTTTTITTTTTNTQHESPIRFESAPTPLANFDPPNSPTPTLDHSHSSFIIQSPSKSNHQNSFTSNQQQSDSNSSISNPLASIKIKRNSINKSIQSQKPISKKLKSSTNTTEPIIQEIQSSSSVLTPNFIKSEKKRKSNNPTPISTTTITKRPNKSNHSKPINNLSNKKPKLMGNNNIGSNLNQTKTGEFDLNDPNCWGALFGGSSEKKSIEKPNKPIGNLPHTTTYVGTSTERLLNRTKQRFEQKKLLKEQSEFGFDLMKQGSEMMNFEIDYKILVRDMALKPIPNGIKLENPTSKTSSSTAPPIPTDPIPFNPTPPPPVLESSVILRPGGYKRYTLPPPPPPPPIPVPVPVTNQNNPLMYTNHSGEIAKRKILPKPSLFGSSFFIWQKFNLI